LNDEGSNEGRKKRRDFCATDYAGVYEHYVKALQEFKVREPKIFEELQRDLAIKSRCVFY
jgi:hypothetical protein